MSTQKVLVIVEAKLISLFSLIAPNATALAIHAYSHLRWSLFTLIALHADCSSCWSLQSPISLNDDCSSHDQFLCWLLFPAINLHPDCSSRRLLFTLFRLMQIALHDDCSSRWSHFTAIDLHVQCTFGSILIPNLDMRISNSKIVLYSSKLILDLP